jgi:glucose/arabinose dehydrogenase
MAANGDDRNRPVRSTNVGRRAFLGAAVAPVFASGAVSNRGRASTRATEIRLDGRTDGWVGRAPERIAGETNPTLSLEPGTEYAIVWENVDGAAHNVVVGDGSGNSLVRSEVIADQGATQPVEFTATEEMSTYYCEVHPTSMRGTIRTGGATATTTGDESESPGEQRAIPIGPTVRLERVADGLTTPVGFEPAPGESDLVVVLDQVGVAYRFDDGLSGTPFLDVRDRMVTIGEGTWADYDERGLLGFAFHPEYATTRKCYVRYSAPPGDDAPFGDFGHRTRISEFTVTEDGTQVRPDSERVVFEAPIPGPVHNAGAIAFGPDGYLYVTMADGSNTNDTGAGHAVDWYDRNEGGNGQDVTENLLGSVLRIDVDGREDGKGYAVPEDNPLVGREGLDEQYAWGFRNPWRMSFDAEGRLFVSDAGTRRFEEVNLVEKGGNYGWNVREGRHCFDAANPDEVPANCPNATPSNVRGGEPLLDPIVEYPHFDDFGTPVGSAVIGGHFYHDGAVDALAGTYVFGDFSRVYERPTGSIFAATPTQGDGSWSLSKLRIENGMNGQLGRFVFAFGRDQAGEICILTNETGGPNGETGTIHRITSPRGDTDADATTQPGTTTNGSTASSQTVDEERPTTTPRSGDDGNGGLGTLATLGTILFGGLAGLGAYVLYRRDVDDP